MIIRSDASAKIGTGHIMRCLALAQAWQNGGGNAIFATSTITPALEFRLRSEGFKAYHLLSKQGSIEDARETSQLALKLGASWIVVDGYQFGSKFQEILKEQGLRLFFIDDYGHADHYYADLVLNQNPHAHEDLYIKREPYTGLLLGTRYALIRHEFSKWVGRNLDIPVVARKVLVTMGGSDPENMTQKVIQAINCVEIPGLIALTIVGGSNPHYEDLRHEVDKSVHDIVLKKDVQNMPELMAWADIAISSGGTTLWELAFMGIPTLIIILANNQVQATEKLAESGAAINLGWHNHIGEFAIEQAVGSLLLDPASRASMTKINQQLVDGLGSMRVIQFLSEKAIL